MVRTKQRTVVKYGRINTPSVSSSNYFYGSQQNNEQLSQSARPDALSQTQQLLNFVRHQREQGLVDYPSQDSSRMNSQNDTVGVPSVHTISQAVVKRPKAVMKVPGKVMKLGNAGIRKRRYRPGTKALMEIRKYQKTFHTLIQRAPFLRVVKDIVRSMADGCDYRIQSDAVSALQEAAEAFLVTMFEAANMCAFHGKRVTVMPQDFVLVDGILKLFNSGV